MANNNTNNNVDPQNFWDFLTGLDSHRSRGAGTGVDHADGTPGFGSGFPFNGEGFNPWGGQGSWGGHGPWGRGRHWSGEPGDRSRRGRHGSCHHRHDSDREGNGPNGHHEEQDHSDLEDSPDTMRDIPNGPSGPPPPPNGPQPPPPPPPPHHHHHPFGRRGRGGRCGRGGHRDRHGPAPPPPPPYNGAFDFRPWTNILSSHPLAQNLRSYMEQASPAAQTSENQRGQDGDSFVPPVDIFNTEKAFVIHMALPGAAKEDVGVNWDADKSVLNVAGVVYRPGNEELIQCLASSERRVGMFERNIPLPPAGASEKDDVDAFGISAKMENGILVITVPKLEKEWTEIHKVDIE